MKLKTVNFTLMVLIISSPVSAQKIQFDFQSSLHNSMSCKDNPNGVFCIEVNPGPSGKTKGLTPIVEDFKSLENMQKTNFVLSKNAVLAAAGGEMECLSDGGSAAATGKAGGFCLVSDLSSPTTDLVSFSVANGLPATGLQFLQITLRDGSILVGSREISDPDDPMSTTCVSAGGSTAATGSDRGFCLAADLATAIPAAFAVANGLPIAGVHFLQVMFAANNQLDTLSAVDGDASIGAKCVSIDGSTAVTGNIGGFCLVSDLNISTEGDANFAVANALPVTSIHYLQVTFGDGNVLNPLRSHAYPQLGVECVGVAGSSANTGGNGVSCLASDLYSSTTGTANISFANDLPIIGMQFLQATFADSGQLNERERDGASRVAKCVSDGGSMAIAGNAEGFCLVSDRSTPTIGFANLAFANDFPVASLHFLQIPFKDRRQQDGLGYLRGEGAPVGVVISDSVRTDLNHSFLPDIAGIAGYKNHYLRISQQKSGIKIPSDPRQRHYLRPVFITSH